MNIEDRIKTIEDSFSLHYKIEAAKNLLLKESQINNKTHTLTSLGENFNLTVANLIALAKDGLVKLNDYFLRQGYINEYKKQEREFGAKLHRLEIASLGGGGSPYRTNPFLDKYCRLGKGLYEKLENALQIELDAWSFEALAKQDISRKFMSFNIGFSVKKIEGFLNEKIDNFIKDELDLSTDKTHRFLSYQRQKDDFVIAIVGELVKGQPRNNLKIDYTQIWKKDTILQTNFIETALGMEKEGLIEIKDIIYKKDPNSSVVMTSDSFWRHPTMIQLKALQKFDEYCGLIRGKFTPLIQERFISKKEASKKQPKEAKLDILSIRLKSGLLTLNKDAGFVKLNDFETSINPSSQEFKVLLKLMSDKNRQATYADLLGETASKANKRNLAFVIRNIKNILGILPSKTAKNKDIIRNIKGYGYRLII